MTSLRALTRATVPVLAKLKKEQKINFAAAAAAAGASAARRTAVRRGPRRGGGGRTN